MSVFYKSVLSAVICAALIANVYSSGEETLDSVERNDTRRRQFLNEKFGVGIDLIQDEAEGEAYHTAKIHLVTKAGGTVVLCLNIKDLETSGRSSALYDKLKNIAENEGIDYYNEENRRVTTVGNSYGTPAEFIQLLKDLDVGSRSSDRLGVFVSGIENESRLVVDILLDETQIEKIILEKPSAYGDPRALDVYKKLSNETYKNEPRIATVPYAG